MPYFCFFLIVVHAVLPQEEKSGKSAMHRYEYTEPHMGTVCRLQLYASNHNTADRAAKAGFTRIQALNTILSDYQSDSELMKLCQSAGQGSQPVSPELFTILQASYTWGERSQGAFDVSIGPLIQLWRRARRTRELPSATAIRDAQALVGYRDILLNAPTRSVTLPKPKMRLDLGGIAKGYVADEVQRVLHTHGITSACVAMGGDVCVSLRPPGTEGWVISIAPLDKHGTEPVARLLLENQAVSTAGDMEQFVEIQGIRYSHIVDPKTGLGLVGRMSCTVVAPRGIDSDAADTAICIMGHEKGFAMIENQPGMAAIYFCKDGEQVKQFTSSVWKNLRKK